MSKPLPKEIIEVGQKLQAAGHQAFLVGGCVRDLILNKIPNDWDVATDAKPETINDIFEHTHYDNDYGTVRVVNDNTEDETLKVIEVTTFRKDIGYSDGRRPDQVEFSLSLSEDLSRRDFTINALAYSISHETNFNTDVLVDEHGGLKDLRNQIIRTVGNPQERFQEDALRLIRAIRFSSQLGFMINHETLQAIQDNSDLLSKIAVERIQEEFNKLIKSDNIAGGMELLQRTELLKQFIPELEEGIGIEQNQAHSFTVWEHLLRSAQAAADKNYRFEVRLAALFHDIGKPRTREWVKSKQDYTFYNHEMVGAKMTKEILERLKYPKTVVSRVTKFVRWHMFFSDPDEITLSAVRRLLSNVGEEAIWDLINLRICDRIGTGRPKEEPYRLRKFQSMIEEVLRDPISVKMLAINGNDLMNELKMKPSPVIGEIMKALMEEVLEDPKLNNKEFLMKRAEELLNMTPVQRKALAKQGQEKIRETEQGHLKDIRSKYYVD